MHNGIFYSNKNKIFIIDKTRCATHKFGKWFIPFDQLYDSMIEAVNESNSVIINNMIIPNKIYSEILKTKDETKFNELLNNIKKDIFISQCVDISPNYKLFVMTYQDIKKFSKQTERWIGNNNISLF